MHPRDTHVRALRPGPCQCYLLWQKELCKCDHRSCDEGTVLDYLGSPKCNQCPYEVGQKEIKLQKEEASTVTVEAEVGVTWRHIRGHRWPSEAGRGRNRFSLGTSRRNQPCQHLDFSPVKRGSDWFFFHSCTRTHLCCFTPLCLQHNVTAATGPILAKVIPFLRNQKVSIFPQSKRNNFPLALSVVKSKQYENAYISNLSRLQLVMLHPSTFLLLL